MNTRPFDLTLVPAGAEDGNGERLAFALTGTDYRAPVTDPAFEATRPYWEQLLPSESAALYRGEHLAARLLAERGAERLAALADNEIALLVRESAAEAYDEGYTRGVHDEDATAILRALLRLYAEAGLLRHEPAGFVVGATIRSFLDAFRRAAGPDAYGDDLAALGGDLAARKQLVEGWLIPYAEATGAGTDPGDLAEAVAVEVCPELERYGCDAPLTERVEGLLGDHPRIGSGGTITVRIDELLARTGEFRRHAVHAFRAQQRLRTSLVAAERGRLRLDDHRPRVMSAFVRNRLLDEVYLPLIGDSLAKQLGTADTDRRTDSQGLLLLVSPPGYGKTTLMEYVADRLGMVLVKISGPNLGHGVTSLDPAQAPSATVRQEIEKSNFALEAGNP